MAIENILSNQSASVYCGRVNSTELVLQPCCSRGQAIRAAWLGLLVFEVLLLPLTILPTSTLMIMILMILSATAPLLQNHWLTHTVIILLWIACVLAIAFFTGKGVWMSGYTTFTFDCIQQQFVIHTVNLLGQKYIRKISFAQIQDAKFQEFESEGISIAIWLLLKEHKILGFPRQEILTLSSFTSEKDQPSTNSTMLKHHQELLLLVRKTLGLI